MFDKHFFIFYLFFGFLRRTRYFVGTSRAPSGIGRKSRELDRHVIKQYIIIVVGFTTTCAHNTRAGSGSRVSRGSRSENSTFFFLVPLIVDTRFVWKNIFRLVRVKRNSFRHTNRIATVRLRFAAVVNIIL